MSDFKSAAKASRSSKMSAMGVKGKAPKIPSMTSSTWDGQSGLSSTEKATDEQRVKTRKAGGAVSGAAQLKPRLDRAQRKAGGRVKKDDGGSLADAAKKADYWKEHFDSLEKDDGGDDPLIRSIENRKAQRQREGTTGPGYSPGMKKGGAAKRASGGKAHSDVAEDKALIKKMVKPEARTAKKYGGKAHDVPDSTHEGRKKGGKVSDKGRVKKQGGGLTLGLDQSASTADSQRGIKVPTINALANSGGKNPAELNNMATGRKKGGKVDAKDRDKRASGGRTRGKTNITIIMAPGQQGQQQPQRVPVPVPVGGGASPPSAPPPAAPAPMMAQGLPPGLGAMGSPVVPPPGVGPGPSPLMRKSGGRVPRHHFDAGAGSGVGRLEKIGHKP